MTSSSFSLPANSDDQWFQETAATQIRRERLAKAEKLNGRMAMLGFLLAILTEALSGYGILGQLHIG
ncbi:MAG: high light inducible protein [Synechococcus sp. SB0678_bin_12]|nr:chlorophyll a/b-binding protein [Cyanobacteria bacterium MAG IRC1_bin_28]MDE0648486.1 chlorophyll a/b-binding protein [Cyanobacteria bacterium MAG IRC4_bin_6]MYF36568.1 high light inducible protein [Synechococcus sp. SB0678_bin_12]MYI87805.1 high light inducible protein [Synechococcus sp. SB0672_bin_10]